MPQPARDHCPPLASASGTCHNLHPGSGPRPWMQSGRGRSRPASGGLCGSGRSPTAWIATGAGCVRESGASTSPPEPARACLSPLLPAFQLRGGGRSPPELKIREKPKKWATFELFATLLMPSGGRQERALRRIAKSALRAEILVRKRKVGSGFFEVDRVGFLAKRPNSGSEPAQGHFRPAPHGTFGTFANPRTRASTSSPAVTPKSA